MSMLTRRSLLMVPLAAPLASLVNAQSASPGKMLLAMHQNTTRAAGFQASMEGWARAGIRYVELGAPQLNAFLEGNTLAAARRLLADLDLIPVSAAMVLQDLWLPGPARAESLEAWRRGCEQMAELGLRRVYSPSITNRPLTTDDFVATPAAIHEAGEIAAEFELDCMIEFTRTSTHLATLTSALDNIRSAGHPRVKPMLDFFHFWSGLSKFEDLDLLQPGELAHAHFQDLRSGPRELIDNDSRLIPGDGIAPVERILQKLAEKEYAGSLSVELFRTEFVDGDPYEVASEIRPKCEEVMRAAGVL